MTNINISDQHFYEIISIIGYPLIDVSDLELTKEQIENYIIIPSVREFYRWFPITSNSEYSVSGSFNIEFPLSTTFSIVDARLNTVGDIPSTTGGNAYINSRYWSRDRGWGYGTGNDYGFRNSAILRRATNQSIVDTTKSFKISINENTKKVIGYSNYTGKLNIIWANYSEDFSDIPYNRINQVIKLCQSKLLENLIMIRGQSTTELPQEFNLSLFESKYTELKDQVMNKWKAETKVIIMKG